MAETRWLLALAQARPWILGVTGWINLAAPNAAQMLESLAPCEKLKGIRPMEGVPKGPEWLSGPEYTAGLRALSAAGLVFEALLHPQHLPGLAAIARRHPDLAIIIDHAAKPTAQTIDDWEGSIAPFACMKNVACKLSGFTAQSQDMALHRRVWACLLETFSTDRLLWGSDYPVLLETADYQQWLDITHHLLEGLAAAERTAILHTNARRLYGLPDAPRQAEAQPAPSHRARDRAGYPEGPARP